MSGVRDFLETLKFCSLPLYFVTPFLMCPHWSYLLHFSHRLSGTTPGWPSGSYPVSSIFESISGGVETFYAVLPRLSLGVAVLDSCLRGLKGRLQANTCYLQCFADYSLLTISGVIVKALKKCCLPYCLLGREGTSWSDHTMEKRGGRHNELQEEDTEIIFSTLLPLFSFQLVHKMCLMQVRTADTHRRRQSNVVYFHPASVTFFFRCCGESNWAQFEGTLSAAVGKDSLQTGSEAASRKPRSLLPRPTSSWLQDSTS